MRSEPKLQTVLITGASSGIGACFAASLAARGYRLVLVARSVDKLQELADRLKTEHGATAIVLPADLTKPGAAEALKRALDERQIAIDLLINNAGFGLAGALHKSDATRNSEMVALNVTAVVELCQSFLPDMVARKSGGIINVASAAAFQPLPGMALYGASKSFVLSFSEALAAEVRRKGVVVTALCPGPVDTPFFEATGTPGLRNNVPSVTMMRAEDVVAAALEGFEKGRPLVVPGLSMKLTSLLPRFLPRQLVTWASGRMLGH